MDAHAQVSFGDDDPDGGDAGGFLRPRKLFSNPWKQDAGAEFDSGPGLEGTFKKLQGGSGGSGSGFLKERAPTISDIMDSDASFLPGGGDGGKMSFSFSLPSFGANIDAGQPDAGPVVAPVVRVGRPRTDVTPLTAPGVPEGLLWARLPDPAQERLRASVPPRATWQGLARPQRLALWDATKGLPGWNEGAAGFLLGTAGEAAPARLVALGWRADERGTPWFYGGFVAPRDGRQPVDPRVVLAASANVGRPLHPRPALPGTNRRFVDALRSLALRTEPPPGVRGPLVAERVDTAVIRTPAGLRVETLVRAAGTAVPFCMDLLFDDDGRFLRRHGWSPVCEPVPVTGVDIEGDGVDEVLWRSGDRLALRRYPDGAALDEDPPPPPGPGG